MSGHKSRHKHRSITGGKSFIILPIIYCLVIYAVIFGAVYPYITYVSAASRVFFSDNEKSYSTEYDNIFVPMSEEQKKEQVKTIPIKDIEFPKYGDLFGHISIDDCGVDADLFYGDGEVSLRNGIGTYNGSFIPGYGKIILLAGHNNTYFNGLKNVKKGQEVVIETSYGVYKYKIKKTAVKKYNDRTAFDLDSKKENLVMYTCYPFDEIGLTPNRYFVYAKFVSGPVIDKEDK